MLYVLQIKSIILIKGALLLSDKPKIKIRVHGTEDAKDVLIAYQRAFNYKWFHALCTANQINYFN